MPTLPPFFRAMVPFFLWATAPGSLGLRILIPPFLPKLFFKNATLPLNCGGCSFLSLRVSFQRYRFLDWCPDERFFFSSALIYSLFCFRGLIFASPPRSPYPCSPLPYLLVFALLGDVDFLPPVIFLLVFFHEPEPSRTWLYPPAQYQFPTTPFFFPFL